VLELAEEALDEIALSVDAPINGALYEALPGRGDVGFGATGSDQVEQRIGVIPAVSDDVTAFEAGEQDRRSAQIVVLSGRQHETHRQAILIDQGVDLGAQSSTRTADGVILAPFFPPAACWCARMMELSMKAIECGDLAAKVSKICTQTPALAQRLKRL